MRILNLYIARNLFVTTAMAVGVLTFVMVSGNLMKVFDLLARGLPAGVVGRFLLYLLPVVLTFTVPLGVLCSSVLVFSRLSADNEITALRASGVSLWQIISPALLLSMGLSVFCLFLQASVAPRCQFLADHLKRGEGARSSVALLDAGVVELPGYILYIGRREGQRLEDVSVYVLDEDGKVVQDGTARSGTVTVDEEEQRVSLVLHEPNMNWLDRGTEGEAPRFQPITSDTISFSLSYGDLLNRRFVTRRVSHMDVGAIFACIHVYAERGLKVSPFYLELHTRMSMALSPLAFLLLGIPCGIRTRRSETSVGLVVSFGLALCFYLFIVLADGMKYQPEHHPEYLVWIPNVLYQLGGLQALRVLARR